MAQTLVGPDFHLALDVLLDRTLEVTLDLQVLVDVGPDLVDLLIGEVPGTGALGDPGGFADLLSGATADAEHVGERDDEPLLSGDVDAGDTCH